MVARFFSMVDPSIVKNQSKNGLQIPEELANGVLRSGLGHFVRQVEFAVRGFLRCDRFFFLFLYLPVVDGSLKYSMQKVLPRKVEVS